MLLVREQLSLPPGLFLNVATTVLSVCNLPRNRHHLTRTLKQREEPFSGIPTLHRRCVWRSLSAQGHLWLLAVSSVSPVLPEWARAAPSGAQVAPQWLREGTAQTYAHKTQGLCRPGQGVLPRPTGANPAWSCCVDIPATMECASCL